ncbi:type II toxin-antitoxin system PemK/MazF family toxin [Nocardioides ungokensis]|uniref:type II toxin-antitoxin system PemK/MazF family toxin n=1 Tax=Nocardioides ungokensis TaxID=1643322 RepID=UPI0015DEC40A|nr:type II toxin-antitoxin system PemK/MazF family toxin [Nocardioides ungokensis]
MEKNKTRPCVIVQNDRGNAKGSFPIIVPLTDYRSYRGYPEQVEIPAHELGTNGKRSIASCGEVRQIDKVRIDVSRGVIATLPEFRMRQIDDALRAALAL